MLEALKIPLDLDPSCAAELIGETNIAFLMAPAHHPAMRHAASARRELGVRTIFNCLGPLANPARATHQLLGAYEDGLRPVLAQTLQSLGTRRAWVVRGADGLDEVSPYGVTRVTQLDGGSITELEVRPEDFGLTPSPPGAADGGSAASNARVLEAVLRGESHASGDAFLLNAAAAIVVATGVTPEVAAARAQEAVASGAAIATLERWRAAAQAHATA